MPQAEHAPHGCTNAEIILNDYMVIKSPFALIADFLSGSIHIAA